MNLKNKNNISTLTLKKEYKQQRQEYVNKACKIASPFVVNLQIFAHLISGFANSQPNILTVRRFFFKKGWSDFTRPSSTCPIQVKPSPMFCTSSQNIYKQVLRLSQTFILSDVLLAFQRIVRSPPFTRPSDTTFNSRWFTLLWLSFVKKWPMSSKLNPFKTFMNCMVTCKTIWRGFFLQIYRR